MLPTIFFEKDFFKIFNDIHGYGTVFLDRIRERQWYELVYDNSDVDTFYCSDLVRKFYLRIDIDFINLDLNQFLVHLDHGIFWSPLRLLRKSRRCLPLLKTVTPFPLIEYMTLMGARCTEQDCGLRASTTFRNIHCVGCWIQCNILDIDHTTSFNRPALQIIHSLMTRQHTVCLNTILL